MILDKEVLKLLSHIRCGWELDWDHKERRYVHETSNFAKDLNQLIEDIAFTPPPVRYHDSEDALAEYVFDALKWPIRKENGRWVGANYDAILEQGGIGDVDQYDLLNAATGRVYAAFKFGQTHYDQMEASHRRMLGANLSIIIFRRLGKP